MDKINLYSEDMENDVLGCIVAFDECNKYIKKLEDNDFYIKNNQVIFSIIRTLYKNKSSITITNIKEKAKQLGYKEKSVYDYLLKIMMNTITSANIEEHIKKIKNYSIRREILEKTKSITDEIYKFDLEDEAGEIKKKCIQKLANIKTLYADTSKQEMTNVIAESTQDIENKYLKRDDLTYRTGIIDLDKITDGLHEQELTIIAARPGVRQNKFCTSISRIYSKKGCIYVLHQFRDVSEAARQ